MKTQKLIGARIKELRKIRKLSQEKLAELVDIDPKHLSVIEVGRSYPSMITLEKIAKSLNVEISDIFDYSYKCNNSKEIKKMCKKMIDGAEDSKLVLLFKIIRDVVY